MRRSRRHLQIGVIAALAILGPALFFAHSTAGQDGQAGKAGTPIEAMQVERLSAPVSTTAAASNSSAAFAGAAALNARHATALEWTFGGKAQRGWALYEPLVAGLIDAEGAADSAGFAASLARWQQARGLEANGVLDGRTWFEMIGFLQGQRIKDRAYPSPDELVTVPAAEFHDPTRPEALRKVERRTYAAYRRMIAAAEADPNLRLAEGFLKIISAFRSREYQAALRKQSPRSGRAGLAVNSPHFTGRALDLYVGGDPVSTRDDNRALQTRTPAYRWLVRNAARFGFRPYFYEPWHWEYVGTN